MPVVLDWLRDRLVGLPGKYREPFVGAGSVFLALAATWQEPRAVCLNDARRGVASMWAGVRDYPEESCREVARHWLPNQADRVCHRAYFDHTTDLEGVGPDSPRDNVVAAATSCLFQRYHTYNASLRRFRDSRYVTAAETVCRRFRAVHRSWLGTPSG